MDNKEEKDLKEKGHEHEHHEHRKYLYFVDGEKFEVDHEHITGALIKAKLPESKRGYALYLEGHGNDPDTLINDDTSISLEREHLKHFYTVPPASFGIL